MMIFMLAWVVFGIMGGLCCAGVLGGLKLLADLRPQSRKGALRLFAVCVLGALGGALAGIIVQAIATQARGGASVSGPFAGGFIGVFLLPFIAYSCYHLLESLLARSEKGSGFAEAVMKSSGCVVAGLAPIAGAFFGAQLGSAIGAGSFLLGGVLGPFVGGIAILFIPLLVWVALHSEMYGWSPQRGASRGVRVSGRAWVRMSELRRQSRSRSRRWD